MVIVVARTSTLLFFLPSSCWTYFASTSTIPTTAAVAAGFAVVSNVTRHRQPHLQHFLQNHNYYIKSGTDHRKIRSSSSRTVSFASSAAGSDTDGISSSSSIAMTVKSMPSLPISSSSSNDDPIMIDGSLLEGGGQILRNAITYATILQDREVRVHSIRAKRSKPGLKAQHVAGLRLAVDLCGGTLIGADLHSTEIRYIPPPTQRTHPSSHTLTDDRNPKEEDSDNSQQQKQREQQIQGGGGGSCEENERIVRGEIATAGSICLLLQAALPCALLLGGTGNTTASKVLHLILTGGTNASMAPQYDYWEYVFLPTFFRQCCHNDGGRIQSEVHSDPDRGVVVVQPQVVRRGYFPKGGGEVHVRVVPLVNALSKEGTPLLKPIHMMDRGDIESIWIRSFHAGKLPRHLAQQMANAAESFLRSKLSSNVPSHTERKVTYEKEIVTETSAVGSGLGILCVAKTTNGYLLGGSALSTPKKKAKEVGIDAAQELWSTIHDGGCVDEWLQDQLILYMALADGTSEILTGSLTLHTQTAIEIAKLMTNAVFEVIKIHDDDNGDGADNDLANKRKRRANSTDCDSTTRDKNDNDAEYGTAGRIHGKHIIRCHGIGFSRPGAATS